MEKYLPAGQWLLWKAALPLLWSPHHLSYCPWHCGEVSRYKWLKGERTYLGSQFWGDSPLWWKHSSRSMRHDHVVPTDEKQRQMLVLSSLSPFFTLKWCFYSFLERSIQCLSIIPTTHFTPNSFQIFLHICLRNPPCSSHLGPLAFAISPATPHPTSRDACEPYICRVPRHYVNLG